MTRHQTSGASSVTRGHAYLLFAATGLTYLLITMGSVVCVSGSGLACPDWPGCFGQAIPPLQINAIIEYLHRFIAGLTTPFILAAAYLGWRRTRSIIWVSRPPVVAIPFLFAVVVFGAFAVLTGIPPAVALLDLGSALIVLALLVTATVVGFAQRRNLTLPNRLALGGTFAPLALSNMGAVFIVLVSAVLVAEPGSLVRCLGWPMFGEPVNLAAAQGGAQVARNIFAVLASILIVAVVVQAWRTQREHTTTVRTATLLGVLFLIEIAIGLLPATGELALAVRVFYVAIGAALWATSVALAVLAGLTAAMEERGRATVDRHPLTAAR